jgi:hypothetical protein
MLLRLIDANAYMGSTLAAARAGDRIFVIPVTEMPFILRFVGLSDDLQATTNSGRYQWIGTAYIHGLMGGEAMVAIDKGEKKLEVISLV